MENTSQQDKEPVYFLNDTILEAVKFLNYEKWSQMRFLCHRFNQLIHSNQSNLQAFEVKSLSMGEIRGSGKYLITSFDEWIAPADAVKKWFQDRGYSCDETTHIPLEKVFVGMNLSWGNGLHVTVRAFFDEPTEKIKPRIQHYFYNSAGLRSRPLKLFSAEFNAKEVSMFPPMTNKYCDMTSRRPIRCDQFTLEFSLQNSLKWLKENVRAKNVTLSFNYNDKVPESDLHAPVSEFILLDASVCARGCIKLDRLLDPVEFVKILLKKYETLEETKTIPNILIEDCRYKLEEYFESNLVHQDHPPLYDKFCNKCNIKSYELQNKIDESRKIIAQVRYCYDSWKCSNRKYMVYIRFE